MNIKNLKITKKAVALVTSSTIVLGTLSGCGNYQMIDNNKLFNVAIDSNNGYISVVAVDSYLDYEGDQVCFITEDGMEVLTSTHSTQLMKTTDNNLIDNYALMLAGNDEDKVIDYNKMQGVSIDVIKKKSNKEFLDDDFTYNKVIILSDNTATIANIDSWRRWEEDDKVQIIFRDETCLLTNIDNIKLINDENAQEDSLYHYALSLVGDEENIIYYDREQYKRTR